jgi:RNA polymerase sigma factor (sigma-70 family)
MNYEDIVRKQYASLKPQVLRKLTLQYSALSLEDAENIYQDAFLAVWDNLKRNSVRENTSWNSYIMTICINMAQKTLSKSKKTDSMDDTYVDKDDSGSVTARKVDELLKSISEEDVPLYRNIEAQAILGDELAHMPEPCGSIVRMTYYYDLSDAEIVEELDGYSNAQSVKSRRWQCMKSLTYRVKMALYNAGLISDKPIKK